MRKKVIFEGATTFANYKIVDGIYNDREARVLYSGKSAPQSGMALDDDPELLFDYNQRFLEIVQSIQPASVLIIGGGTFTLPTALFERMLDITIDVIEIDPLLPNLAAKYFNLPDDPRLSIFVQDGAKYMKSCQKKYDMIIVDAFFKYDIIRPLLAIETAVDYKRCLTEGGIVAINFIARYHTYRTTLAHQLSATFKAVFDGVELYPSDYDYSKRAEQNLVLVASLGDMPSLDYLQSAPVDLLFTIDDVLHR